MNKDEAVQRIERLEKEVSELKGKLSKKDDKKEEAKTEEEREDDEADFFG